MTRELIAQAEALEWALERLRDVNGTLGQNIAAVDARAAALRAQAERAPEAAPVAWQLWLLEPLDVYHNKDDAELEFARRNKKWPDERRELVPLYRHPPAAEVERLRGLLREAIPHVGSFDDASSEALLFRIQAALGEG